MAAQEPASIDWSVGMDDRTMPVTKPSRPDATEFAKQMLAKYPTVMAHLAEDEGREKLIESGGEESADQPFGDALGGPKS